MPQNPQVTVITAASITDSGGLRSRGAVDDRTLVAALQSDRVQLTSRGA